MKKVIAGLFVLVLFTLSTSSAWAETITIEQHQSINSEFHSECSGTCTTTATASFSQHQGVNGDESSWSDSVTFRRQRPQWNRDDEGNRDGEVVVFWSQRGGTCTIRYTEASSRSYNYQTTTACDEGQLTIGGLVPGRAYRFQIKKDTGRWSSAGTTIAR